MKNVFKLKIKEILDLLVEFIYLAIIFIVPLYFSFIFPTYNVFELAKTEIFRILVCLLLLLSAIRFAINKNLKLGLKKYFVVPLIFIIGLGLSLFASTNIVQSFFGSYERQAGYLSYIYYFLWFVLLVYNILTIDSSLFVKNGKASLERRISHVVITAVLSGLIVSLYGILQILGIDFLSWPEDPLLTRRTISTFGQPNFLASWLVMVIPLSAYLAYSNQQFWRRFFYSLILMSQLVCLFFTSSRGGLVSFILVALLFIIYIIFFSGLTRFRKLLAGAGLIALALLGLFGINYFIPGRISSMIDFKSGSMGARLNFYQAASDAIIKKPFLGYGLENSGEVFISYYQPDWGVYGDIGATTDRAHNLILDIVLASGVFGLFIFTLLYYYLFSLARDNIKKKNNVFLSLAIALGAAGYLFSLFFSFSIVAGEIYFWLFLSLLIVININKTKAEAVENALPKSVAVKIVAVLAAALIASGGVVFECRVLVSDYYFNELYYSLGREQYYSAFLLSEQINKLSSNSINREYYNVFLADKLSDLYPNINDPAVKQIARAVLSRMDVNILDMGYGNVYAKAKINAVLENYDIARSYYIEVISQAPYWPKTYLDLAHTLAQEGRDADAIAVYKITESILPDINDGRYNEQHRNVLRLYQKVIYREMGNIYLHLNNYFEAQKYFELAYRSSIYDYSLLKKIADTYYLRGDLKTALVYNERGAARNPSDYNWFLSLAVLSKELGNPAAARAYLDEAIKLAPEEKKLQELRKIY